MGGTGSVVLGHPTIPVGPLPTSSIVWPSDSRASHLVQKYHSYYASSEEEEHSSWHML